MYIPPQAARALEKLEAGGYESYVVGGCVRDSLLGIEPHDWDICTSALPEAVESCFASERVLETGMKHGTVTLLTADGPLEITTFRRESAYSDGRRPDRVDFIDDIHEDLLRRDFTVNAMAYSPRRGLRDDFGGEADLRAGIIRCVGDAEARLREDALRILRALRFAARYGFDVEPDTASALRRERERLRNVSAERIFSELTGILSGRYAGNMLRRFPEIFFTAMPELSPEKWEEKVNRAEACPADAVLRLACLFSEESEKAGGALARLRSDNHTRETVMLLAEKSAQPVPTQKNDLRRLLAGIGQENLRRLLLLRPSAAAEALLEEILAEKPCLCVKDMAIGGKDLLALGVPAGAELGGMLSALLDEILDEKLFNGRDALLHRAEEMKEEKGWKA